MKLFIAIVLAYAAVLAESIPSEQTEHNKIAVLLKLKEHVGASAEFEAMFNGYFETIAKGEEVMWSAAKEIEGILASVENTQVPKDIRRIFYINYDAILYSTASTYNKLNPQDPLAETALLIYETLSDAATRVLGANWEISQILNDNAPDVLPQVQEINVRTGIEINKYLTPLLELLTPYLPK